VKQAARTSEAAQKPCAWIKIPEMHLPEAY